MEEKKDKPLVSMSEKEREEAWDDIYVTEKGIIIEFESTSNTGKLRSLNDDNIYKIDNRELTRTKIELRAGDKVLFAPIKDADGDDHARVIRIIELNV